MYRDHSILALIGARSGSKGLPDKNICDLGGKPLLSWTVHAALGSRHLDRVVLSTDSPLYAEIGAAAGADVPFLRPPELATDESSVYDAIDHALDFLSKSDEAPYDYVALLQPTSPFRTSAHIDAAIEHLLAHEPGDASLVSVCRAPAKVALLMREDGDGGVRFCFDVPHRNPRRQELPRYFLPNGAIYLAPTRTWDRTFYMERTLYFEMDAADSIDVDDAADLEMAKRHLEERDSETASAYLSRVPARDDGAAG